MGSFLSGLLLGWLSSAAVSAVLAVVAYRRIDRLQRRAREAERLAELGTLTGGLAHEIKNPLSTIQLNLQLLREDISPQLVGPQQHNRLINRLSTVQRETGRLREILDDFLRYAGRIELEKRPVDVHQMFEELVDFFAPQAQIQRVQLRVRPCGPDDGWPDNTGRPEAGNRLVVELDDRLIKQAVLNLMINALQAMPERGGEVILSACREGNRVKIQVTDTGAGIPPDKLGQIFDAYYSTKKGGTGLGLAITKRVAEEHGGRVYAQSYVGKGSAFTIEVPGR